MYQMVFESMQAKHIFLQAQAVIKFVLQIGNTFPDSTYSMSKWLHVEETLTN